MIVVVVGDDQHIGRWKFLDCVAVAAFEGRNHPRKGRSGLEHGVDEHRQAVGAHKHRRVAEPNQRIVAALYQRVERGVDKGQRLTGFDAVGTVEKKLFQPLYKRLRSSHRGDIAKIVETPVAIMGRTLNACQAFAARRTTEDGMLQHNDGDECHTEENREENSHKTFRP